MNKQHPVGLRTIARREWEDKQQQAEEQRRRANLAAMHRIAKTS